MNTLFCFQNIDFFNLARFILEGQIVAFPTETVYGLGVDMRNEKALEALYELKKRPKDKSFIIHVSSIAEVEKIAKDIPDEFYRLADKFFPGPLTIVLKKKNPVSSLVSKGETVAVRMPNHKYALELIKAVGYPIVGTSANFSDQKSAINAREVERDFGGKIAAIIDGGECSLKKPSTIVDLTGEKLTILRQGSVTF